MTESLKTQNMISGFFIGHYGMRKNIRLFVILFKTYKFDIFSPTDSIILCVKRCILCEEWVKYFKSANINLIYFSVIGALK